MWGEVPSILIRAKVAKNFKHLLTIICLFERSDDNTLTQANQVFVWKINWQCFVITYLNYQITLLWHGPIKYLSERSIDNTSGHSIWSDHSKNVFLSRIIPQSDFLLISQISQIGSTNQVNQQIILYQFFSSDQLI